MQTITLVLTETRAELRTDADKWMTMCKAILELRAAGFKYREIDETLILPYRARRVMNGGRFKALQEMGAFEEAAITA
jgi:hypothetical protein